jgi:adenylate cyclase
VIDTAGDSVLAVFETATGAVTAALAVQAELSALVANAPEDRRMQFRIGVHLGDVIEKPDGTVYGDGVNIAARLQGLAEPGGVMVSESIRTAVRGKVGAAFDDQGEQQVKNIQHQVRAYRLSMPGSSHRGARSQAKVCRKRDQSSHCPTSPRSPYCRSRT